MTPKRMPPLPEFPHLFAMIEMIALDNNMSMLAHPQWPYNDEPLPSFEEIASKLTTEQKEIVSAGERDEAVAILTTVQDGMALDYFLNRVFDGKYRKNFYE